MPATRCFLILVCQVLLPTGLCTALQDLQTQLDLRGPHWRGRERREGKKGERRDGNGEVASGSALVKNFPGSLPFTGHCHLRRVPLMQSVSPLVGEHATGLVYTFPNVQSAVCNHRPRPASTLCQSGHTPTPVVVPVMKYDVLFVC